MNKLSRGVLGFLLLLEDNLAGKVEPLSSFIIGLSNIQPQSRKN
jgi:hypothetical protein